MTKGQKSRNPLISKDRLEMFSDGVFAIAITLLVLEIKIPRQEELHEHGGLLQYIWHIWPSFVGYFVGFLTLGIYWSTHNWFYFFIVKKTDHKFNLINIFFLLAIALMPFSIAIVSDYVTDPGNINAAVTIYNINMILPQLALLAMLHYGRKTPGIFDNKLKPEFLKNTIVKLYFATLLSFVAIVLSLFFPIIALILDGLAFLMYFMPPDKAEYIAEPA